MRRSAAARWLLLATLWSLQYIFMRVAVPVFGTAFVAEARAFFSMFFLVPWVLYVVHESIGLRAHWRDHLAVSLANNVLPFLCLAYAATVLPASYLAVMNGMVPLWAAVTSALFLKEPFGARRILGFVLGMAGVALIVNLGPIPLNTRTALGVLASILGSFFWGWAGVVIRQRSGRVPAMSMAAGSIIFCALILSPAWATMPPPSAWTGSSVAGLVALGILVSGVAYLPFFTLVRDIGPTRTLTVGLAVPVLGIIWGWLLLGEEITPAMIAGAALVLLALGLVMSPASALGKRERPAHP
ncbi:MAG TPA: DMT family transporter [Burkholderiales bacterium]|nr:DMT family transporter [Burkholderiales bacterium]